MYGVKITDRGAPVPVRTDRERKTHKKQPVFEARVRASLSTGTKQRRNRDKLLGPDVALDSEAKQITKP